MNANDKQVGGEHYKSPGLQHWDLVFLFQWDYFQSQVMKYLMRWRKKNGLQDLEKAAHFLQKYIEGVKLGMWHNIAQEPAERAMWLQHLGAVDPPVVNFVRDGYVEIPRGSVNPTGWRGFTFEGAKDDKEFYRCKECKEHFAVPIDQPPVGMHACEEIERQL